MAFRAGGFFPATTAVAAIAGAVALVLRVTLSPDPFAGWSRLAAVTGLGAAGLACLTLVSAAWSDAPVRATVEFDRALLYLEVFVLFAMTPRGRTSLIVLLRWLLLAFVVVCVAGLASRLAPDVFPTSGRFVAGRLAFPLTYWNAMGIASAIAAMLALAGAADAQQPRVLRVLSAAVVPIGALALYLSFSRGAIAACAVGLVLYIVCVRSLRLWLTLVAVAPPTALVLWVAYGAEALGTGNYAEGAGPSQGHRVALVLAASIVVAAVLALAAQALEPKLHGLLHGKGPRRPAERAGALLALGLVVLAGVLWVDVPGHAERAVESFRSGTVVPDTGDARDRLTQVGNNGRLRHWEVALDVWAQQRLLGTGAGTFELGWEQRRPSFFVVRDAHSLALEMLAELGVVGLVLLMAVLLTPLAVALARGLVRRSPDHDAHAVVAAAGVALLVHACVDWDWEMPSVFVWFFAAAGVVVAAPLGAARAGNPGRTARVLAGLACLLLAVTPWLVAGADRALQSASAAFARGDCRATVDAALTARDRLPIAPEPYELLGYCNLRGGAYELAVQQMQAARDRDPDNWRYAYGLAVAQAIAGQDPRPAAADAARLNPFEPLAQDLRKALDSDDPGKRFRAAARAQLPGG
ncbi:O-antigen ligase family protein [Solirubrobacter sp. CPCC 204708]|uniref:O-antigen ligase family protein n=1 Tax=Solirubrobacter deserti TaxID=2282478 RepID=A0ABT4RRZ4_9ACTN|nr:O-antigen ligase family protein [Solirubrobacter deserti]MBE2318747.1 O-antigen ligase family protein [Solirubrobacter deserti]MDA0141337.1 O-antigen ligase family protein [Solirubrobacter deserti]